jgi:hypothetical protein
MVVDRMDFYCQIWFQSNKELTNYGQNACFLTLFETIRVLAVSLVCWYPFYFYFFKWKKMRETKFYK